MSDAPKRPDEGESTLLNGAPPAWEAVAAARLPQASVPPVAPYPPQGYLPPPGYVPPMPPPPGPAQAGYRPVYDGTAPTAGAYGAAPLPPNYSAPGYPPYRQPGYPQNNYGGSNVAEMLAVAALMPRWRRRRRHILCCPSC